MGARLSSLKRIEGRYHFRIRVPADLLAHSDRGSQYLAVRYTERLAEAGIEPSVGGMGDSCNNAPAGSIIGLFETGVVRQRGPWRGIEQVEFATLEWVDWFTNRRLLEPIGDVPPAEFEPMSSRRQVPPPCRLDSRNRVSGQPGAVHCERGFPAAGPSAAVPARPVCRRACRAL